jgi:hypothetical protein
MPQNKLLTRKLLFVCDFQYTWNSRTGAASHEYRLVPTLLHVFKDKKPRPVSVEFCRIGLTIPKSIRSLRGVKAFPRRG